MEATNQDRIDLYLSGRMPFVDRLNFEFELETNLELRELYQFTLSLQTELHDRRTKRNLIANWKEETDELATNDVDASPNDEEYPTFSNNRKKIWYRRIGWAAAAVFLLLFLISLPDSKQEKRSKIVKSEMHQSSKSTPLQLDKQMVREVSSQNMTTPAKKLTIQQQQIYWKRAQNFKSTGQYDECVKCLCILQRQEGIYRQKADSMLNEIYHSQHK